MVLFGFILFGTLCASSDTWIAVSFFEFEKFTAIISSNTFLTPFSLSLSLSLSSFYDFYNASVGILDIILETS